MQVIVFCTPKFSLRSSALPHHEWTAQASNHTQIPPRLSRIQASPFVLGCLFRKCVSSRNSPKFFLKNTSAHNVLYRITKVFLKTYSCKKEITAPKIMGLLFLFCDLSVYIRKVCTTSKILNRRYGKTHFTPAFTVVCKIFLNSIFMFSEHRATTEFLSN